MGQNTKVAIGNPPAQLDDNHGLSERDDENVVVNTSGELIVVHGDKVHVWHDGTHYVEDGEVDNIQTGDVFFGYEEVGYRLARVREIDPSKPDDVVGGVTVDLLFDEPSLGTDAETTEVEWHKQMLTGLPKENAPMGYTGPLTRLTVVDR